MNMNRLFSILRARFWLIVFTFLVTVASTVAISLLLPKTYTATTSMVIDVQSDDPITKMPLQAQMIPGYMATQMDILTSHKVALTAVDMLKLDKNADSREQFQEATQGKGSIRDWLANALLEDITLKPSAESSMIQLTYSSADPHFSAAVANAFTQAYVNTNLELTVNPARRKTAWLDDQLAMLRTSLEDKQARLSSYQQEKGIVDTDERVDMETARLNELSTQLVTAQSQSQDMASRQSLAGSPAGNGEAAESLPEIISNTFIQGLKSDLSRQEAKLAELSEQKGPNNPAYKRAAKEADKMRTRLKDEVSKAASGIVNNAGLAQTREDDLTAALVKQKARVMGLKREREGISVYARDVENAQHAYDDGVSRFNAANMESQLTQTNVSLLNEAVEPSEASSPKLLLNTVLAIFFGGLLGLGLALVMEMLNRHVRSADDISADLGLPVIGVITRRQAQVRQIRQVKRLSNTHALPGAA